MALAEYASRRGLTIEEVMQEAVSAIVQKSSPVRHGHSATPQNATMPTPQALAGCLTHNNKKENTCKTTTTA